MRRLGCATSSSFLLLMLACTPATNGIADGSGSNTDVDTETGDGDGDPSGDGDGDPTGDGDGDPTGDGDGDPTGDGDGDPTGDGDGDNTCSQLGCDCDGSPGSCDPTLMCADGSCVVASCGNGAIDANEVCDDANQVDGDGCDADCTLTEILQVAAGGRNTCALIEGGRVRCWGESTLGVLGIGVSDDVGDNETPADSIDIPFPAGAVAIDIGELFACAMFDDDAMRCWGTGSTGQLGNANNITLGDNEELDMLPAIDLGGVASMFSTGGTHACALLGDELRCWGKNMDGQLGIGGTQVIGDNEAPGSIPVIDVAPSVAIAAGADHTCAISVGFDLACWGRGDHGRLGYGNTDDLGNDVGETPATAGKLDAYPAGLPNGTTLVDVSLGKEHSCARFSSGDVICWGRNDQGELGRGDTEDWGDAVGETPATADLVNLAGDAVAISAGAEHTCAILDGGAVRCWGRNDKGQLGLGMAGNIGDTELPNSVGPVDLGGPAVAISAGSDHTCALLSTNEIVCWGENVEGRLGYGHVDRIGDNETPASQVSVEIF